ncbi:MAG: hypothetical protein ACK45E_09615, partial [Ignavibacteria bacterium]
MKNILLPLAIAVFAFSWVGVNAQDVGTRNLILRGTNTTPANVGTLTVTTLTGPRTYTLPDASGTLVLSSSFPMTANRPVFTDNNGLLKVEDMSTGSLIIGKSDGSYAITLPTGTRGLVVTPGNGTLDFALPTGTADALLRYDNAAGGWVPSANTTLDGNGNLSVNAVLGVDATSVIGGLTFGGTLDVSNANTTMKYLDGADRVVLDMQPDGELTITSEYNSILSQLYMKGTTARMGNLNYAFEA